MICQIPIVSQIMGLFGQTDSEAAMSDLENNLAKNQADTANRALDNRKEAVIHENYATAAVVM